MWSHFFLTPNSIFSRSSISQHPLHYFMCVCWLIQVKAAVAQNLGLNVCPHRVLLKFSSIFKWLCLLFVFFCFSHFVDLTVIWQITAVSLHNLCASLRWSRRPQPRRHDSIVMWTTTWSPPHPTPTLPARLSAGLAGEAPSMGVSVTWRRMTNHSSFIHFVSTGHC